MIERINLPEGLVGPVKGYVRDDKSLKRLQEMFGDVLVSVFRDRDSFMDRPAVDKQDYWSGQHLVLEFSNGKFVEMWNSEWAQFAILPKATTFE